MGNVDEAGYDLLKGGEWKQSGYSLSTIRKEDIELVRIWRNEQMDGLRQSAPISKDNQVDYFNNFVFNDFTNLTPQQILLRYSFNDDLIGYGGIVHLDWCVKKGEVSFLLEPSRTLEPKSYCEEFAVFLKLIKSLAFKSLGLNKLTTEAYAHRSHHVAAIESAGFTREGILREHAKVDGEWVDAVLSSCLQSEYFR